MHDYFQAAALAVLQGVTEFLPVSSYGHLVLLPQLAGWRDHGLGFDVAVHVGTLLAVVVYFRADLCAVMRDWCATVGGAPPTAHSNLAWAILLATVITAAAAVVFEDAINRALRAPLPVAVATLVFGVLLGVADRFGRKRRAINEVRWRDAVALGCAQALALIPGTSRSGVTITAALMLGLTRDAAARFSFLMAIPVITLAGVWQARGLAAAPVDWQKLFFATLVSSAVAFGCIHWFLFFLRRHTLMPFVIYRVALGVILLIVFW